MPRIYEFNDFIKHTYGKEGSRFTCVLGPNGTGKTSFNLLQMERIHELELGDRFGSNMPTHTHRPKDPAIRPSFDMDFIEDFETLEQTCRILNPNPEKGTMKKYFFFLSELGKFVPKDEAWKADNRKFIQSLQTVRKYGLCLLSDGIDRIDSRILSPSFFNGIFYKPFPENPQYAQYRDLRSERKIIFRDIPECKMWFDTYYTANFYMEQQNESSKIDLDQTEQIVKIYRETGSWKKAGITTQQGKRELFKVLDRYFAIRKPADPEPVIKRPELEEVSTE